MVEPIRQNLDGPLGHRFAPFPAEPPSVDPREQEQLGEVQLIALSA
jgi:hypothetical protein